MLAISENPLIVGSLGEPRLRARTVGWPREQVDLDAEFDGWKLGGVYGGGVPDAYSYAASTEVVVVVEDPAGRQVIALGRGDAHHVWTSIYRSVVSSVDIRAIIDYPDTWAGFLAWQDLQNWHRRQLGEPEKLSRVDRLRKQMTTCPEWLPEAEWKRLQDRRPVSLAASLLIEREMSL